MDGVEILLRILHILFGTFWAGASFLFALVIIPQLRAFGPRVERPFWLGLLRSPVMVILPVAAFTTIGTGVAMGLRERWGHLDTFLDGGWGWAILVGFAATIAYVVLVSVIDEPNARTMKRLLNDVKRREPTGDEAEQLARANHRMMAVARAEAILMVVAVGAMAAARFV
jgi:uncharacterized membrane protein